MHCVYEISKDLTWIGANDRRLALFENLYPIPNGISYNSYLLKGEKTVLFDTVDRAQSAQFLENLAFSLDGRRLDYVVISHMEPDHAATLAEVARLYPESRFVVNDRALQMLRQFFDFDIDARANLVAEGNALDIGGHTLHFYMAPMVHWPEVMVTYDSADKTLFTADAFGTFGALSGNLFADETAFDLSEARRYYANIVGKYGRQTAALLQKAAALEINTLCPLHGPVWREGIAEYVETHRKWAHYQPEERAVVIAYATVYGGTENAANILATQLAKRGVKRIAMYDVSVTDHSHIVAECFRASHLVFASTTYNAGVFLRMEQLIATLSSINLANRTLAFIENGSWAPTAGAKMRDALERLKNMQVVEGGVTIRSAVKPAQAAEIAALADAIAATLISEDK
ncbi:MAG: FprA family A-type flavoprotein [Christensenellales bacterium]|jgi:flavorubredoxin